MNRDEMVEMGSIVQSPDGRLWRVLKADHAYLELKLLRGKKRIRISWHEYGDGWELKFP